MIEPPQKGVISPGDTRPTYVGCWIHIHTLTVLCLTCHGYSFTSVSTPPTILARLLAWPQLQVLLLLLEVVAAVGVVVVVLALEVVVEDVVAVPIDGGDVEVSENVKNMILPI